MMQKTENRRSEFNAFADDLRKELAINRVALSESNKRINELLKRLNDSEAHSEVLRKHLLKREQAESVLKDEFERHLAFKDNEIAQLREIVLANDSASKVSSEKLYNELAALEKHSASSKSRKLALDRERDEAFNNLLNSLKEKDELISKLSNLNNFIQKEVKFETKDLKNSKYVKELEESNHRLLADLEESNNFKKELISRINSESSYSLKLAEELKEKDLVIAELSVRSVPKQSMVNLQPAFDVDSYSRINEELERSFVEAIDELRNRLDAKDKELDSLASVIEKKEFIITEITARFEKTLKDKELDIDRLSEIISRNASAAVDSQRNKAELLIVQSENKKLSDEISQLKTKLKDSEEFMRHREDLIGQSVSKFEDFAADLNSRNEVRIQELVKEFSEKELKLKVELEQLKNKLMAGEVLFAAKEKEIDSALDGFSVASKHLLSLKVEGNVGEFLKEKELTVKEKELSEFRASLDARDAKLSSLLADIEKREALLHKRDSEIKSLLSQIEDRADSLTRAEAGLKVREELLVLQQKTLNKELAVFESAGFEFKEIKKEEVLDSKPLPTPVVESKPVDVVSTVKSPPVEFKPVQVQKVEPVILNESIAPIENDLEPPVLNDDFPKIIAKAPVVLPKIVRQEKPKVLKIIQHRQVPVEVKVKQSTSNVIVSDQSSFSQVSPVQTSVEFNPDVDTKKLLNREVIFGTDREGFSEVDEIISIIEIAKEHGDSSDLIMQSLVNSGYKKDKIDAAFKKLGI